MTRARPPAVAGSGSAGAADGSRVERAVPNTRQRDDATHMSALEGFYIEPFMEWATQTGMNMEWVSGGYGYFFVKSFGAGWVMG